jgi:hypothetical protein
MKVERMTANRDGPLRDREKTVEKKGTTKAE